MIRNWSKIFYIGAFILTVSLGIFFRFYKLGSSPSGIYLDEAALGYNAYSILKTGKDEFGLSFPLIFRSFGDFKAPIYTYITVPIVKYFGLLIITTRITSAIFGLLTLPILFLLVKKLSPKNISIRLAAISTILLAISPWHLLFSRTSYETNVSLFFLILGCYLFYLSIRKPWAFILCSLSFSISFLAYHAERLIIPVLFIFLIIAHLKPITKKFRSYFIPMTISIIFGLSFIMPTIALMRTPGFLSRVNALNIISNPISTSVGTQNNFISKIVYNQKLSTFEEFASLYVSYFSPRYLFSLGDYGPRSSFPEFSTFFVWQLPFLLYGFYRIINRKDLGNLKSFILVFLFISPVPAALTRDPYTTIRSLTMVVPLIIIISLGLISLIENLKEKKRLILIVATCLIAIFSLGKLYLSIFYYNNYFHSSYWNYGWEKIANKISNLNPDIPIIVNYDPSEEPYIQLLFFLKYDPQKYQKSNFEVPLNEYYTNMTLNKTKKIGNIIVKKFQWGVDTDQTEQYIVAKSLAISKEQQSEHCFTLVDTISYPNNDVAFNIFKTNPQLEKDGSCAFNNAQQIPKH